MSTQPEALRLADELSTDYYDDVRVSAAANELRRLHTLNTELVEVVRGYISDYQSDDGMYAEKHYVKTFSAALAKVEASNGND